MRFTGIAAKVRSDSQKVMVKPRVQWLTEDHSLWEIDWLRFLFKPVQDYIEVEFEKDKIKKEKEPKKGLFATLKRMMTTSNKSDKDTKYLKKLTKKM